MAGGGRGRPHRVDHERGHRRAVAADLKVGLEAATDAGDAAQAGLDSLLAAGAEHGRVAALNA
jgi:hypothetical protein